MTGRIFISYSKQDPKPTQELARFLKAQKFTVWWDTDLASGEVFRDVIDRELNAADAVVVIWTAQSIRSKWVMSEADHADEQNKLVPARTDEVNPSQIPKPYNGYHTDLVHNHEAILIAVRRKIEARLAAGATASKEAASSSGDADERLFNEIEQAGNPEAYQFYLDEFPQGRHAPVARFRLFRAKEQSSRAPIAVPAAKTASQTKPKIAAPQTIVLPPQKPARKSASSPGDGAIVHAKAQITGGYKVPRVGRVAAVSVLSGSLAVGALVRVLRGGQEIYSGAITSLQIDRQYVAVAESGASCGLLFESFTEFDKRDILELAARQPYALLEPRNSALGRGKIIGRGTVIALFDAGGAGRVAGCRIDTGRFVAGRPVRVARIGDRNVHIDAIVSLKIHDAFVLKAEKGLDCGIRLLSAYALNVGDTIECCES